MYFNRSGGQAYVIFKTREAAKIVITKLDEKCLLLSNGRCHFGLLVEQGLAGEPREQPSQFSSKTRYDDMGVNLEDLDGIDDSGYQEGDLEQDPDAGLDGSGDGSVSSFAAVIKTIILHQEEEMKLKESRKEYLRKKQSYEEWFHKYHQRRTETERGEDVNTTNTKDHVSKRQFAVESLNKRLEEEVDAYQRHCIQVREKSLGSLSHICPSSSTLYQSTLMPVLMHTKN